MGRSVEHSQGWELKGKDRERYVEGMFDRIAGPYDRLNRLISLGRDERWRRIVVRAADVSAGGTVVDIGTGTGDLGLQFADAVGPQGRVLGLDLAAGMLAVAAQKRLRRGVPWYSLFRARADATGLPRGIADAVSMGWVLRNVGDRAAAYAEILRILKPGGRFVCVDMSRPRGPFARAGFWTYRHAAMPLLARLSGGDRSAYRYLAGSTDTFPDAPALAEELRATGFTDVSHQSLMLGSLAVHVARKPS